MTIPAVVERLLEVTEVLMKIWTMLLVLTFWCIGQGAALAQMPMNGSSQSDILKLMGELPPETKMHIEQLGKLLQQDLKEGKLTEAQILNELMSGNFEQKLRTLHPEAGPLLDDLTQATKQHSQPEDLTHILDGLAGSVR